MYRIVSSDDDDWGDHSEQQRTTLTQKNNKLRQKTRHDVLCDETKSKRLKECE